MGLFTETPPLSFQGSGCEAEEKNKHFAKSHELALANKDKTEGVSSFPWKPWRRVGLSPSCLFNLRVSEK